MVAFRDVARLQAAKRLLAIVLFFFASETALRADSLLMTLSVDSSTIQWQDEFVLRLEIYGPSDLAEPEVGIEGLDQFQLKGMGKNLFQVPRGKTKKWILTYTLTAREEGSFKLGPAVTYLNGRRYQSNTLFVTVQPSLRAPSRPTQAAPPPAEKTTEREKPVEKQTPTTAGPKPSKQPAVPNQTTTQTKQPDTTKQTPAPSSKQPPPNTTRPAPSQPQPKPAVAQQPAKVAPPSSGQAKPNQLAAPQQKPAAKAVPSTPAPVVETPKAPDPPPPLPMFSAKQIGDRVLIVMEAQKSKPYRAEGLTVTLRLLAQLPVENLRFKEDPEFPGFIKYDYPFSTQPKAIRMKYRNENYVSYELQKFLLFPLKDGEIKIPSVTADLKVRIPSGAYAAADPVLDIARATNGLSLNIKPVKQEAIVGRFLLRNQIVEDEPQSKTVRLILEGEGLLSTFDFPSFAGNGYHANTHSSSTNSSIQGNELKSRKTLEMEIQPQFRTTNVVLPELKILQFNPDTQKYSYLALPALPLKFAVPIARRKNPPVLPPLRDNITGPALVLCSLLALAIVLKAFWPEQLHQKPELSRLFRRKNLTLTISKSAARKLYGQMAMEIARFDATSGPILEVLKNHLPQEEWLHISRAFRRLEAGAFAPGRETTITYDEMKNACRRVEGTWLTQ